MLLSNSATPPPSDVEFTQRICDFENLWDCSFRVFITSFPTIFSYFSKSGIYSACESRFYKCLEAFVLNGQKLYDDEGILPFLFPNPDHSSCIVGRRRYYPIVPYTRHSSVSLLGWLSCNYVLSVFQF